EVPQVAMQVAAIRLQIENGIADDLAGTVVGHVAPSPAWREVDAPGLELLGRQQDVSLFPGRPHGDDVRMLQQEQQIRDEAFPAFVNELQLQIGRRPIAHLAQMSNLEGPLADSYDG